ncbi:MAG TPA: hypothetical protein VFR91_09110 [Dyella sp.]|nr:hypothetical protein [Dyella sp.]
MKTIASLTFVGLSSLAIASCACAPRIDGSSAAAFERSHAAVIASLSPQDRLRLSMAEAAFLSCKGCLSTKPMPDPFLNTFFGGQADLSTCRRELNGLSFKDIMNRAYPRTGQHGGGAPGAA